jgi:N-acetyl-gamma-glutamyl-phosphate reductase / acetylglutamate kinase
VLLPVISRCYIQELYGRDAIRAAKRISNPGCYATSTQLLVAPLLPFINTRAWPTVFGVSGYSGAGTVAGGVAADGRPTTVAKVTPDSLSGGIRPYSLTDHIHEREAGRHLTHLLADPTNPVKVAFVPTVAPWFSGIISVLSMPLSKSITAREVRELYEGRYGRERLITIKKDVPVLADVENKHGWTVGGFQVHSEGDRAVVVVSVLSFSPSVR